MPTSFGVHLFDMRITISLMAIGGLGFALVLIIMRALWLIKQLWDDRPVKRPNPSKKPEPMERGITGMYD